MFASVSSRFSSLVCLSLANFAESLWHERQRACKQSGLEVVCADRGSVSDSDHGHLVRVWVS